ncbi:hypothetical protein EVAR_12226_1 [Eumeta japonica]|uniref:Uncharacterized protein n=1 Tax=Eumeta variegata TaxID=151549 RepID=A0A4C1UIH9_EUMVA|nr:hypothetical protein EVAR_12226_1 [Eumeta japonica]
MTVQRKTCDSFAPISLANSKGEMSHSQNTGQKWQFSLFASRPRQFRSHFPSSIAPHLPSIAHSPANRYPIPGQNTGFATVTPGDTSVHGRR